MDSNKKLFEFQNCFKPALKAEPAILHDSNWREKILTK